MQEGTTNTNRKEGQAKKGIDYNFVSILMCLTLLVSDSLKTRVAMTRHFVTTTAWNGLQLYLDLSAEA